MGFVLGITKDMKILNLVKERIKSDSQGLGLQDEGKKKEKPEEVMNQGSGTWCQQAQSTLLGATVAGRRKWGARGETQW